MQTKVQNYKVLQRKMCYSLITPVEYCLLIVCLACVQTLTVLVDLESVKCSISMKYCIYLWVLHGSLLLHLGLQDFLVGKMEKVGLVFMKFVCT